MASISQPIARGPLVGTHRRAGAQLEIIQGWEVAVRYPRHATTAALSGGAASGGGTQPAGRPGTTRVRLAAPPVIVDISHQTVIELTGSRIPQALQAVCNRELPIRSLHASGGFQQPPTQSTGFRAFRLTATRAIVFGDVNLPDAVDVTGGWSSIALAGLEVPAILAKLSGVDLRDESLPIGSCCQAPVFGVGTLFGRFAAHFELHICPDSAEFLWQLLLDAGQEFQLTPVGLQGFAD